MIFSQKSNKIVSCHLNAAPSSDVPARCRRAVIAATRPSLNRHCHGDQPDINNKMGKKSKRKTKTKVVVDDVTITSDEELFKDPPAKEDCPICFLPMPIRLFSSASLPPATILSVPINNFAIANQEAATEPMEKYYSCCGKSICRGCVHSFSKTGNDGKCPFCNSTEILN